MSVFNLEISSYNYRHHTTKKIEKAIRRRKKVKFDIRALFIRSQKHDREKSTVCGGDGGSVVIVVDDN